MFSFSTENTPRTAKVRLEGSGGTLIAVDYGYDAMGRQNAVSNPSRITISNWTSDGLGYLATKSFDSLGRVTSIQAPDGGSTSFSYSGITTGNSTGRVTAVTDPAQNVRKLTTDALGRLVAVAEDANNSNLQTNYTYDPLGDLLTVQKCVATGCTSASSSYQGRTFVYNGLGRLTKATNPESGSTNYTYDANGNLQTLGDALGYTTVYSYDALNRLTGKVFNDNGVTPNVTYAWDPNIANGLGRLGSVSRSAVAPNTPQVVRNYTAYDSLGEVTASNVQVGSYNYSFNNYSYDLAGSLTKETYPSGRVLSTVYDGAERPTNVSGVPTANGTPITNYVSPFSGVTQYWPHGAPYAYQYANSVVPVFTFDKALRPAQLWSTVNNSGNNWLAILSSVWNTNGTLQSTTEGYGANVQWGSMSWFTTSYGYDALNRLNDAQDAGWHRGFGYDAFGNMSVTLNTGVNRNGLTPYSPNGNPYNAANNRLLAASYDLDGRVQSVGTVSLNYDQEGNVNSSHDAGSSPPTTVYYTYDGEGNRVQKTVAGGATTIYARDAFGGLAAEYSSVAITPACVTCYLGYDHLGSARLVTDQNYNVVARHDYLPYGEEIDSAGARTGNQFGVGANVNQKFTGQERDPDMNPNVDFFNARYFSAVMGSFLRPDPGNAGADLANPQTWNGYAYVAGNPLSAVDPSGMEKIDCNAPNTVCVSATPDPVAPVGTWAWWMDGGWQTLNGSVPIFTSTTYGVVDRNPQPVSAPITSVLNPSFWASTFAGSGTLKFTKNCVGSARALQGNTRFYGKGGAFQAQGVLVQPNTAAVIPQQFFPSLSDNAANRAIRPFVGDIRGTLNGENRGSPMTSAFTSVSDILDNKISPVPGLPTRAAFQQLNPGRFVVEVTGPTPDLGIASVQLTVPAGLSCPVGTAEVP